MAAGKRRWVVVAPGVAPGQPAADGISTVFQGVVGALRARGVRPEIWTLHGESGTGQYGAHGNVAAFSRHALAQTWLPARGVHVVCLHLHLAPPFMPWRWCGARLTVYLHGIEAWQPLTGWRRAGLARATSLLAVSRCTLSRFQLANPELGHIPAAIVPPGIPAAAPGSPPEKDWPDEFILTVGRMESGERYKGHDQILDIWPHLSQEFPRLHWVIAGGGTDRERLEERARAIGASGRIHFLGRVSDGQLRALYSGCRFLVMPSQGEGFGLVYLEAMRAGKACVAGQGAAEEIVENGKTGRIVDAASPAAILDAIWQLLAEPEKTQAMGDAAKERFHEKFTESAFARRFAGAIGL